MNFKLKIAKKQNFTLSDSMFFEIYLWVKAWIFLNETSMLIFAELAIRISFIFLKNKHSTNCQENH